MTRIQRNLLWSVLLGLLLLAGLALYADVSDLSASVLAFDWIWLPVVLLLSIGNYLIRFIKWHAYLGCLDLGVPKGPSFLIFFSGYLLTVTPGKLGELMKSGLLKESYGVPVTTSAPIVFAERLTDFLALLLLTLFGVMSSGYGVTVIEEWLSMPIWLTPRAWDSWRSATSSTTASCGDGCMPIPGSGPSP